MKIYNRFGAGVGSGDAANYVPSVDEVDPLIGRRKGHGQRPRWHGGSALWPNNFLSHYKRYLETIADGAAISECANRWTCASKDRWL